ncbi:arginine/serine-rich coiled-coil protein 2 [Heracleum sosnowskyi]|uniref:Arginine/serine-rich coiled-coil protein 2 n=1 Tax=Heracleum sosnowskyi TaxID=360622 RepID=A0AAD8MV80_9APIA|nr:arginine/serine-rich coiled-coil protein 2 [Heracleum sosnowskyi]
MFLQAHLAAHYSHSMGMLAFGMKHADQFVTLEIKFTSIIHQVLDTMDSNLPSSPADSDGAKAAFRKPSNDVVNRKYRRRSPVDGSSSSDGSPTGARESSPVLSKENPAKSFDDRRKQDDRRDLGREYGRSEYGRTNDSHKHYGRHSSRNTDSYHRYDDYKREKCVDEDERKYPRSSFRSGRDSRAGNHSDYTSRDSQQNRSRDDRHSSDKYTRRKTDFSGHRSRDRYGGSSPVEYENTKDRGSSPDRVGSGDRQTNLNSGVKSGELDRHRGIKHERDDKRDYQRRHNENKDSDRQKHSKQEKREAAERSEGRTFSSESHEKKAKLYSFDGSKDQGKYGNEKEPLTSQLAQTYVGKVTPDQGVLKDSDIDAAKVAAMKAAELVNKNLALTGGLTTDQKKKMLWGSKKSTTVEEATQRWDSSQFLDRERQEKFNKLMSLRLHWYLWGIVGCKRRAQSGTETQPPRWKCGPNREAESIAAGFGKAVYRWTTSKRWSYSRTGVVGNLGIDVKVFLTYVRNHSCTLLYKFEMMGAYAGYESTFFLNLLSLMTPVKCDHAIKRSVCCKNLYLKLRSTLTGNHNDIAMLCFFFRITLNFDSSVIAMALNIFFIY